MPQLHPRDACVIVTGGGSGIGAAMARRLAPDGAHVVVGGVNAEPGPGAGALTATAVADAALTALSSDRFLILPYPEFAVRRATDPDRRLDGMNRIQQFRQRAGLR